MENITNALFMAFGMLAFVIAFSISIYLINSLNDTARTMVYSIDGSYYDSLSLNNLIRDNEDADRNRSRVVGVDTIIPTLYRYYKESFAVKILDSNGELLQYFDTTTESDVNIAKSTIEDQRTNQQKALLSLYDDSDLAHLTSTNPTMFGAPWLANINKDAKTRIDMYIGGKKGYINNTYVDYSNNYLNQYADKQFKETFTQYAYEGDTVSDEENGELVTLTGSKQISNKIIIIYQLLN